MKVNSLSLIGFNYNKNLNSQREVSFHTKPLPFDSVSFGVLDKNKVTKKLNIDYSQASNIAKRLSVATSGHRAPYMSENFNPEIVNLITLGVSEYAKKYSLKNGRPTVIIGGDTRVATRESLPKIKETLTKQGVDVIYIEDPVPTPLLALAAKKNNLGISILMTASHNPWTDGGFNFITPDGAVAPSTVTQKISKNMEKIAKKGCYKEDIKPTGLVYDIYPYEMYKNELEKLGLIDFEKIKNSGLVVYYDGLQGTGNYVVPRMLIENEIPYVNVKSSGQEGPNPTDKNLEVLEETIANAGDKLRIGLANDGDADRFGIVDEKGNFIDPNDVILLTAYHLIKNKGLKGDIVRSQATSKQIDLFAKKCSIKSYETPVGFKYLADRILKSRNEGKDIIVAGEESGGLTTYGHIPEKDGILAISLIMDLVAKENKPVSEILKKVKRFIGVSSYIDNYSKKLKDENSKKRVIQKVENRFNSAINGDVDFGELHKVDIQKTKEIKKNIENYRKIGDGYKFVMTDGSTVLVRKSGTEPLVRFYIETLDSNPKTAQLKNEALKEYIENIFSED